MRHGPDDPISGWQRFAHLLNNVKAARVILALILGAAGSLPLVILTPPFQVPDEVQHFYRAYQLSELHVRAEVQNGRAGGTLPESLPQFVKASVYTQDGLAYPATPAPLAKTWELRSIPLNASTREFVAFPGSAFYSPLPYLPQAVGIAAGRIFGAGPLGLLYVGRSLNCLTALALLGLAVYLMPFAEELVMLAGLLPMSLYLYGSLSPDTAVIGCSLVFTALAIEAGARGNWKPQGLLLAALLAAVFCSVKPVYAPMLLAAMVPGVLRPGEAAKVIRSHVVLLGISLGITAGWLLAAKSTMTTPLSGAHPTSQIGVILHQPMILIRVLVHMLDIGTLVNLYVQTIGVFGWLTVLLRPGVVYVLPLAGFFLAWRWCGRGGMERSAWRGLWQLALSLASAVLVVIALYLIYVHVGQEKVAGVQGRYFIPILVLAGAAVMELAPSRKVAASRWKSLMSVAAITLVEIAAMDATIIHTFHIF